MADTIDPDAASVELSSNRTAMSFVAVLIVMLVVGALAMWSVASHSGLF